MENLIKTQVYIIYLFMHTSFFFFSNIVGILKGWSKSIKNVSLAKKQKSNTKLSSTVYVKRLASLECDF